MLSRLSMIVAVVGVMTALPEVAEAQATPPVRSLVPSKRVRAQDEVPESHRPPPGMCRVWIDNVPAAQQPAPTDCPTAIRNRPSNGRVVFSDDEPRRRDEAERDKRDRDDEPGDGKRKGKRKKP